MPRKIEEKTRVIRELLDENPNLTWDNEGEILLKNLGFTKNSRRLDYRITENDFNVRKHFYLKSRGIIQPKEKTLKKDVQITEAIEYVNKYGGIESLNIKLKKLQAENDAFQAKIDNNNQTKFKIIEMVQIFQSVRKAISQAS